MKTRLEILDEWDMVTQEDELGMNVTMLQSRIWPYCIIELWWESLGKFRFTYDEPAEDIMCAFPQGSTSNMSGWDNEELFKTIRQSRGMAALPDLPLEMGSWRLNVNGTILLITNKAQPENHLFVTDRGFYFLDKVGYALKTEGNLPPIKVLAVDVCEELGLRREDQKIPPVEADYELPPKDILDHGFS